MKFLLFTFPGWGILRRRREAKKKAALEHQFKQIQQELRRREAYQKHLLAQQQQGGNVTEVLIFVSMLYTLFMMTSAWQKHRSLKSHQDLLELIEKEKYYNRLYNTSSLSYYTSRLKNCLPDLPNPWNWQTLVTGSKITVVFKSASSVKNLKIIGISIAISVGFVGVVLIIRNVSYRPNVPDILFTDDFGLASQLVSRGTHRSTTNRVLGEINDKLRSQAEIYMKFTPKFEAKVADSVKLIVENYDGYERDQKFTDFVKRFVQSPLRKAFMYRRIRRLDEILVDLEGPDMVIYKGNFKIYLQKGRFRKKRINKFRN